MGGRRSKGEGAFYYSDAHNRYEGHFVLPNGQKKYIVSSQSGTKTEKRKEAQRKLEEAMKRAEAGVVQSTQTVGEYLQSWIDEKSMEMKPGVEQSWRSCLKCHIIPGLGSWRLDKITREAFQEYFKKKRRVDELAPLTVRLHHEIIAEAFNDGVKNGIIMKSPCKNIALPRLDEEEMQYFNPDQVKQLFAHLKVNKHKHEALIMLAITTGLRQGEALGLHWRTDVDLDKRLVHVRRTLDWTTKTGYIELPPKTKASKRTIVLTDELVAALRAHHARQLADHLRHGIKNEKNLVFCGYGGRYLSTSAVFDMWKKVLKAAKLPDIRWHDLRHTAAVLYLLAGANLKEVQELLGHTDIQTTMRYVHVVPCMRERAAERLGKLLFA